MFDNVKASYDGRVFDVNVHPSIPIVDLTQISVIVKTFYEKTTECKNSNNHDSRVAEITTLIRNDILTLLGLLTQPYSELLFEFFINRAIKHTQMLPAAGVEVPYSEMHYKKFIRFINQ